MDIKEAIKERHSVRRFTDKKIEGEVFDLLSAEIEKCNSESGLHIQLCVNEPEAFQASKPHYGSFQNCKNYIAIVAKSGNEEKCGYYGERVVLYAQTLGLNSCWVALTYKKGKAVYECAQGEKLRIVIALGYGVNPGKVRETKEMSQLCKAEEKVPEWFKEGMEAVMLAPTAVNQQKFLFTLNGNAVKVKTVASIIGLTKYDLGIAKYHFEIGAGKENFNWE